MASVAASAGAEAQAAGLKSLLRVSEKLVTAYDGDASKVTDCVRGKVRIIYTRYWGSFLDLSQVLSLLLLAYGCRCCVARWMRCKELCGPWQLSTPVSALRWGSGLCQLPVTVRCS